MKKILVFVIVLGACGVFFLMRMPRRETPIPSPPVSRQETSVPLRQQSVPIDAIVPDPKRKEVVQPVAEEVAQPVERSSGPGALMQTEPMRMSAKARIQRLERLGRVPDDSDWSDYALAENTSWWGKRLDPGRFWSNRVVWLDGMARGDAWHHGRSYPPMPYDDPSVADRSDVDTPGTGFEIEGPNVRLVSSERENAFWDKFVKTHPHPPEDIKRWQEEQSTSLVRYKHILDHDPRYAARLGIQPARLDEFLTIAEEEARTFGYPPECLSSEALRWAHIMEKRREYESLFADGQVQNPVAVSNFFRRVYVDRKYITEPLSDEDIAVANVWKVSYLKRLRAEGTDESYINAYLTAWNLDESALRRAGGQNSVDWGQNTRKRSRELLGNY